MKRRKAAAPKAAKRSTKARKAKALVIGGHQLTAEQCAEYQELREYRHGPIP